MAGSDGRLERRLRYINQEYQRCQRQIRRNQARCQELEVRVRRFTDIVKAYEERSSVLQTEREKLLAQLEPSAHEAEEEKPGAPAEDDEAPPSRFHWGGSSPAVLYSVTRPEAARPE